LDVEQQRSFAMDNLPRRHFARLALAASGIALLLGGPALAQSVQVFEQAPSLEQLRSIMVPESQPSMSRSIVIQRPDTGSTNSVQRVATQGVAPVHTPASTAAQATPEVEQVAASSARPVERTKAPAVGLLINFASNSAVLPDSAHEMIGVVAQVLRETPDIRVRVEGHTDAAGPSDYNVSLSERRALSVGQYLVKLGIDPSRLMLVGKGKAEPLTPNPYDAVNRRVQFVRVG
jgi:outer membrane protein OmpA-like peptidoglycan-associated protein